MKTCSYCGQIKPLSHFMRRTGKRSSKGSRRGTCQRCRQLRREQLTLLRTQSHTVEHMSPILNITHPYISDNSSKSEALVKRKITRALPIPPPKGEGLDIVMLKPNHHGLVRMRGRSDNGSRWHQEVEFEMAVTLVKEHAAVVVNRNTIRRLYSNREFRRYILHRDKHTCFFCGEYGDTIDHLLPRAKGGHTTPVNCVCACILCNQSKADRSLEDFINDSPEL